MNPHTHTLVALAVASGAPFFALAQPSSAASSSNSEPQTIVVTGSREAENAAQAARPVQVITAEDIRASGVNSLPGLLSSLAGVETVSQGGLGLTSSLFLRGTNSNHTVVLVDGVRVGSATTGAAALQSIPLALIDHIEVLSGASSSLYGADAIGGVVQVFTRRRALAAPTLDVAATVGELQTVQLAAAYTARLGDTDVSAGANVLSSGGINATTPNNTFAYNPDRDGYRNLGLQASATHHLGQGHELGAQFLRSGGKVHYDDGPKGDTVADNLTQTLAVRWAGPLGAVRSELRLARAWDESKADTLNATPGRLSTTQDQFSWINRLPLAAGTLSGGLEWLQQSIDSNSTVYSATSRQITSALLGWRATYGELAVQADARYDDNSQFGGHTTGQLGAAWQIDPAWRVRANLGTAFKAPTFNDLYAPAAWGSNPALKPEQATSAEAGADWRSGGHSVSVTVFENQIRHLIVADANWMLQNVDRAQNQGVTLSAATALGEATRLQLNWTLQNPKNQQTGATLQRRAKQFASLKLTHQAGPLLLGGDARWSGARPDMDYGAFPATPVTLPEYSLLALFAQWQITPQWALEGRIDNLADERYTTAFGYANPGRRAQVTLRWTPHI